jgi:hypothetical protein
MLRTSLDNYAEFPIDRTVVSVSLCQRLRGGNLSTRLVNTQQTKIKMGDLYHEDKDTLFGDPRQLRPTSEWIRCSHQGTTKTSSRAGNDELVALRIPETSFSVRGSERQYVLWRGSCSEAHYMI